MNDTTTKTNNSINSAKRKKSGGGHSRQRFSSRDKFSLSPAQFLRNGQFLLYSGCVFIFLSSVLLSQKQLTKIMIVEFGGYIRVRSIQSCLSMIFI